MSDKQQRFDHRIAEIEKQERALTSKLQKVTRREELVAQKERQILEKVQELSLHARQQEADNSQGWFGTTFLIFLLISYYVGMSLNSCIF